mmetsp:Transcript_22461/g.76940  ORF Transcript_22461/g.76940 Transcript_22461/m.76940 type:complete len:245 (+) Transcript_22461:151-885(+)
MVCTSSAWQHHPSRRACFAADVPSARGGALAGAAAAPMDCAARAALATRAARAGAAGATCATCAACAACAGAGIGASSSTESHESASSPSSSRTMDANTCGCRGPKLAFASTSESTEPTTGTLMAFPAPRSTSLSERPRSACASSGSRTGKPCMARASTGMRYRCSALQTGGGACPCCGLFAMPAPSEELESPRRTHNHRGACVVKVPTYPSFRTLDAHALSMSRSMLAHATCQPQPSPPCQAR